MLRREAQHGAQEGDFRPRYPEGTAALWLPAMSLENQAQGYTALEAMRRGSPCHMRGAPLVANLQDRWTPQHLVKPG